MNRIIEVCGLILILLTIALASQPAAADVAVAPWFVGGGTYGAGIVDDFLDEISEAVRAGQKSNRPPPAKERPAEEANSPAKRANAPEAPGGGYTANPTKWGQVYLHMRQGEEAFGMQERPRRLNSREFDPVTGKIHWPQVFLHEKYNDLRSQLEPLFVRRASTSPTPALATEIHDVLVEIIETLRGDIENLPANDYVAARKFLDSLDFSVVAPSTPKSRSPGE
jgi:hypothetical protein